MKVLLLLVACLPFISCQILAGGEPMVGGQTPIQTNLSDPKVILAVAAINNRIAQNGDPRTRTAVKIISATSQVVSGVIYRYKIEVTGGDTNEICDVAVWSQPWLSPSLKIEGPVTCTAKTSRAGGILGGQELIDFTDDGVRNAIAFLETEVNKGSNSLYYLKSNGVGSVTQQVVNGIIYRFSNLALSQSSCTQNTGISDPNAVCSVDASVTPMLICNAEIYWNPRETPAYKMNSKSCSSP